MELNKQIKETRLTVYQQLGRVRNRSCPVGRFTSVVACMSTLHRVDTKHLQPFTDVRYSDRGIQNEQIPDVPPDLQRKVSGVDVTLNRSRLAGVHRLLAEAERKDLGWNWKGAIKMLG